MSTTDPIVNAPVPFMAETTGKQAMQFQPANAAVIGGVVGYFDNYGTTTPGAQGSHNVSPGLFSNYTVNGLPVAWPGAYAYFRRILNDPTVRYVRMLSYAPVLKTQWRWRAGKKAPAKARDLMEDTFNPLRHDILDHMLRGVDYGHACFESCYRMWKGWFAPSHFKPLLHDVTALYTDIHGNFDGVYNNGDELGPEKSLLYTYDGESGNLYGRGRCYNLLEIIPWWRDANEGAAMYDRKIAGVFLVCHYPPGVSKDKSGNEKPNWQIAQEMLDKVAAGHPIAVCNDFAGEIMDTYLTNVSQADRTRWRFEMLEDKGSRQPGFRDRLTYLDMQKARAWMVPERAAFEAQKSGSRADSQEHAGIILDVAKMTAWEMAEALNGRRDDPNSPVNTVLRINFGMEAIGEVWAEPEDIDEDTKVLYREIVQEVFRQYPAGAARMFDLPKTMEQAGMPVPEDIMEPDEAAAVLEDMAAVKVAKPVSGVPVRNGEDATATLARIYNSIRLGRVNGSH